MAESDISFAQRLLTEAVRSYEDLRGEALDDPHAEARARETDRDFEHRLVIRAHHLPIAAPLATALQQVRHGLQIMAVIGIGVALMAGLTAAQVALTPLAEQPLNFFWILVGLLGMPTLTLLIWIILMVSKPHLLTAGSLGGLTVTLGQRISQWLHKGPIVVAVVRAQTAVYAGPLGRWLLSIVSHSLWLAFLFSALLTVIFILSTKHYTFGWETTILSEHTYIALTRTLAFLPDCLGFQTPTPEQIRQSQWLNGYAWPEAAREAWSGLLVGSLVVYGLLPRLLALLISGIGWWLEIRRFRLDTTQQGYARLQTRLLPVARNMGIVDPDPSLPTSPVLSPSPESDPPRGPPAIVGLEIEPPPSWPPLKHLGWLDLGFVESRHERQQALNQISTLAPRQVVVVCSLATTPDRGMGAFLRAVRDHAPVILLLTDGQRFRARGEGADLAQRLADWQQLAIQADISEQQVITMDLAHLTDVSCAQLAQKIAGDGTTSEGAAFSGQQAAEALKNAFSLILQHVNQWTELPSLTEQAELQRAIAACYRRDDQVARWPVLLQVGTRADGTETMTGLHINEQLLRSQLSNSTQRMTALLPIRLRQQPRWLLAGAIAGALGCIAATTLVTPAALAALPLWAGLGAAVTALLPPKTTNSEVHQPLDLTTSVTSAALFALLLALQGLDEPTITERLDQIIGTDDPVITHADHARQWLDACYQRFIALNAV